ncbi:MAG TPA: hypothetical protein VFI11_07695 [Anaerolineales bacterium]|nr:hypothetical protein [Anaerolineales bacterium]
MARKARIVKGFHLAVGVVFTTMLVWMLYEGFTGRISLVSWITVALFVVEGAILGLNRWTCPLTSYAERLGLERGRVTDIFLPKWAADRAFQIYAVLFVMAFVLFVVRVL